MRTPDSAVVEPNIPGPIRRVIISHGLAALGMSVAWPLLLLLVWHETHSDLLLGLAGAARMLPYVLLSWATGRLADRFRRDRVVRWTLYARLLLLAMMASCLAMGWTLSALVAATAAVAVATPAFPALAAAMPTAAATCRDRATDLLVTVEVASFVVGPAIGGALLASRTQPLIPLVAVGLLVAAAALFVGIRLPHLANASVGSSPRVLPLLQRSSQLRGAIGVVCALNAGIAAMALALLPYAEQAWDDAGAAYGLATAALGFGALGAPLLVRMGRSPHGRARAGLLMCGCCLMLVLPAPSVAFALLPLVLAGAANVHAEAAATSIMQDHTADAMRASVLGFADTAMISSAMVASLLAPALVTAFGPSLVIGLVAVGMVSARGLASKPGAARSTPVSLAATQDAA
jgi:MFS family permease